MAELQLRGITKRYGALTVIDDVSLDVRDHEFVVFVGPSGCGKSTLLRIIAGLEDIDAGVVEVGGRDVTDLEPVDRKISMVFQSYALYPHMTVAENMEFGLKVSKVSKDVIRERVRAAAETLKLEDLMHRRPSQLSGGQRQRVAIGRAIVRHPEAFLFDEPLSNLDAELRVHMRIEIAKLHKRLGSTMIYVTHDQIEAMTLADRIVVLQAGRVEQVGTPLELFDDPDNVFVAGFIGSPKMNFLPGIVAGRYARGVRIEIDGAPECKVELPIAGSPDVGAPVTLGVRPGDLSPIGGETVIRATTDVYEQMGDTGYLFASTPTGLTLTSEVRGRSHPSEGDAITLGFNPATAFLFDAAGLRIR
jgi:lactose/L-arabinose transport system ATP-binding protein